MSHPKTIRMKKADAEKWLSALRSGEYKQGKEALKTNNGRYCCLGVLQHCLTGKTELEGNGVDRGLPSRDWMDKQGIEILSVNEKDAYLSNERCSSDGIADAAPLVWTEGSPQRLHELNDNGESFEHIADLIEQNVEYTDEN